MRSTERSVSLPAGSKPTHPANVGTSSLRIFLGKNHLDGPPRRKVAYIPMTPGFACGLRWPLVQPCPKSCPRSELEGVAREDRRTDGGESFLTGTLGRTGLMNASGDQGTLSRQRRSGRRRALPPASTSTRQRGTSVLIIRKWQQRPHGFRSGF